MGEKEGRVPKEAREFKAEEQETEQGVVPVETKPASKRFLHRAEESNDNPEDNTKDVEGL